VPRPNPLRTLASGEENLASRIARERQRRGWSYEGTAARMTQAGCPIQGSAIYKIEKGSPRRRVSVDELVAFAEIFEITLPGMLEPADPVDILIAKGVQQAIAGRNLLAQGVQLLAEGLDQLPSPMTPAVEVELMGALGIGPDSFRLIAEFEHHPDDQTISRLARVVNTAIGEVIDLYLKSRPAVPADE